MPKGARNIAMMEGRPRYFTGKPCAYGHVAERYTSTGKCIRCWSEYYAKNRDGIIKRATDWNKENKEKRYARKHKLIRPQEGDALIDHYSRKLEQRNRAARELRREKPEIASRYWAKYYWSNREKMLAYTAVKNARRRTAVGAFTTGDIANIRRMQRGKCASCRVKLSRVAEHIDHIIPICLGGDNFPSNIQLLCSECNHSKGGKHPIDFAKTLGLLL